MTSRQTSDLDCVDQFLHYLLQAYESSHTLSSLPSPPPRKIDSIRFLHNNLNNYREKYDGHRWKPVCIGNNNQCTNFAVSNILLLCTKHGIQRERQTLLENCSPYRPSLTNTPSQKDEQIKPNSEVNQNKSHSHRTEDTSKSDCSHFKQFSVDSDDDDNADRVSSNQIKSKSESSTTFELNPSNGIEYIGSKPSPNELNIKELISKKIPPLTPFEEIYLGALLMEKCPKTCSILDAQLYLHEQIIKITKKNYQVQINTIGSEYFYDFLLRHPHIAIHYKNWFPRCNPIPPTTGCAIDTKIWTLCMIARGTFTSDEMDYE